MQVQMRHRLIRLWSAGVEDVHASSSDGGRHRAGNLLSKEDDCLEGMR